LAHWIHALAFDKDDNIWLSVNGGILRINDTEIDSFPDNELKIKNVMQEIYAAPDGSLWFLNDTEILSYQMDKWNLRKPLTGFPLTKVEASAMDAEGRLWIGEKQTIAYLDRGKWTKIDISLEGQQLPEYLTSMAITKDGAVWVSHPQGLYRYRDGEWDSFGPSFGKFTAYGYNFLLAASNGLIWAEAGRSILVYDGSEWKLIGENDLPIRNLQDIAEAPDGKIYFLTSDKIIIYDGQETNNITPADGFPYFSAVCIAFGPENSLGIGTGMGLSIFRPSMAE
jgi:ligand-binding sensor domain-containing protein